MARPALSPDPTARRLLQWLWRWTTLGAVLLALVAVPAAAFDKQRAAAKMAEQGQIAYESGDYERAVEMYANAFRTDPEPDYLYAQARAEQLAGKFEAATTHLQEFVANPRATPERIAKAQELLENAAAARLDKQVAEGETAARGGDLKLAAQIWLDVVQKAPKRVELHYRAGVALQQAGDLTGALAAFDAYLKDAPPDAADRSQAKLRRDGIAEKLHPSVVVRPPEPVKPVAPVAKPIVIDKPLPPPERPTPVLGYSLAATGLALVAGGVVVYVLTMPDIDKYNGELAKTNAAGQVVGVDQQTATSQHTAIQNREIAAIALAGAGVALAGVGTWLIVRTPESRVAWVPGPALAGTGVAVRF